MVAVLMGHKNGVKPAGVNADGPQGRFYPYAAQARID
jgi:hypothetical protein